MVKNPFKKKETLAQKVSKNVRLPKLPQLKKEKTTKQKALDLLHFVLINGVFFIAGFVLSKVHTLLVTIG
jgi:ribosomal protein L39E